MSTTDDEVADDLHAVNVQFIRMSQAVDALEAEGVDVTEMRGIITQISEALVKDRREDDLYAWLAALPERSVIGFQVSFRDDKTYAYVAIKGTATTWYGSSDTITPMGSRTLAHWLAGRDLRCLTLMNPAARGPLDDVRGGWWA